MGVGRAADLPGRRVELNASEASAIRSVACGPMTWTPSVSCVSVLPMTLAKPSYSPPMMALAIAWNGTLPTLYGGARLP